MSISALSYVLGNGWFVTRAITPAVVCVVFVSGCGTTHPNAALSDNRITVDGIVSVRGNEPFTALMITTDTRNSYVLSFPADAERRQVQQASPARFRLSGRVYGAVWYGRRFAHLAVEEWVRVDL